MPADPGSAKSSKNTDQQFLELYWRNAFGDPTPQPELEKSYKVHGFETNPKY
jgi:hypothetical protein